MDAGLVLMAIFGWMVADRIFSEITAGMMDQ